MNIEKGMSIFIIFLFLLAVFSALAGAWNGEERYWAVAATATVIDVFLMYVFVEAQKDD